LVFIWNSTNISGLKIRFWSLKITFNNLLSYLIHLIQTNKYRSAKLIVDRGMFCNNQPIDFNQTIHVRLNRFIMTFFYLSIWILAKWAILAVR